jgi:hypothetical protein
MFLRFGEYLGLLLGRSDYFLALLSCSFLALLSCSVDVVSIYLKNKVK